MKHSKGIFSDISKLKNAIEVARGLKPASVRFFNGQILDVFSGTFVESEVTVLDDKIVGIDETYNAALEIDLNQAFIVPGFIDSHVHIESSLMTPARFQEAVLPCGTTSAIWDPHEIANVKGLEGIDWALNATRDLLMDIFVMVPSCVPSTSPELKMESSGAVLTAFDTQKYRDDPKVLGLAEMMNFPGLLSGDGDVLKKLQDYSSLVLDGHCPGLSGKDLNAYAVAGIHSCHESTQLNEAKEKLRKGIQVLVREGSCAKDAHTLIELVKSRSASQVGLCSDDRNPADIVHEGHINFIIDIGLKKGLAPEDLFRSASFAAARQYGLRDRGAIAPGFLADFVVVRPKNGAWQNGFDIEYVYKKGQRVDPKSLEMMASKASNQFDFKNKKNLNILPLTANDLRVMKEKSSSSVDAADAHVIGVIENQIITDHLILNLPLDNGEVKNDLARDILKIVVCERHHNLGFKGIGFVKGFGIHSGAIATSINHDSHNIIAVGSSDELIKEAVNRLIEIDGGIVVIDQKLDWVFLHLPVAGLMTSASPLEVSEKLKVLKSKAQQIGCVLGEPFLQLSFLALPVIPKLKITDQGLVDVERFKKIGLFEFLG